MSNGDNQSRRNFLKVAAAAGATAAIAGCASTNNSTKGDNALAAVAATMPTMAHVEGKQRIRVGLIGCGGRGSGAATDCCKAAPEAQIVAMGDVFKDRLAMNFKHRFGDRCRQFAHARAFPGSEDDGFHYAPYLSNIFAFACI